MYRLTDALAFDMTRFASGTSAASIGQAFPRAGAARLPAAMQLATAFSAASMPANTGPSTFALRALTTDADSGRAARILLAGAV